MKVKLICCTLALLCACGLTNMTAQNATEIIREMDERMRGETSMKAEMTMRIVRPDWERKVSMTTWAKGEELSLILITAPARDEGSAYLKRGNEIWNWVPSVGRTIKMPPSMMMQSWMGSDFTNDDLVRESSVVTDYEHTLAGDTTLSGYDCHIIEMVPKPEAPVVWDRVVVFVSKDDLLQLRIEHFDEQGELVTVMAGKEITTFDGRRLPSVMEMIPQDKPGHKTVLEYQSMEFNIPINDRFFSVQNMKQVR